MTARSVLKSYFHPGAIPKATEFADLIDSVLVKDEDNLLQSGNGPLGIKATADGGLLNFYDKDKPTWQLKQKEGDTAGLSLRSGEKSEQSRLFIDSASGNIGIGTVTPGDYKLNVAGSLNVTGPTTLNSALTVKGTNTTTKLEGPLIANNGATITGGAAIDNLTVEEASDVYIGTPSLPGKLEIVGQNPVGTGTITSSATTVTGSGTTFKTQLRVGDQITVDNQTRTITAIASDTSLTIHDAFNLTLLGTTFRFSRPALLVQNGNVGIGTKTPEARLEIYAKTNSGGSASLRTAETVLRLRRDGISGQTWPNVVDFNIDRYSLDGTNARTRLSLGLSDANTIATSPIMTLRSDGNVGIGTTNPKGQLDVAGPNQTIEQDFIISTGTAVTSTRAKLLSLHVGDQITADGQSRMIMAITSATTLIIDIPFNPNLSKATPFTVSSLFRVQDGRIVQMPWIEVTAFSNGWKNYGDPFNTAAYFKDSLGIVHLKGLVKDGTNNTVIFNLPSGFSPAKEEVHTVCSTSSASPAGIARVDILSTSASAGEVRVTGLTAGSTISLDGITFRAAA